MSGFDKTTDNHNITRIAFAVFVKTPGMSPIKTRLAATIGRVPAERIYLRSLALTREVVENLRLHLAEQLKVVSMKPYWAVAESLGTTHRLWTGWQTIEQGAGDLGARLAHVYSELRSQFDIVCLYGADSPHISFERLADGIGRVVHKKADVVVGPAEDGGFYFFASSLRLADEVWQGVSYSSDTTLAQLRDRIQPITKIGWSELQREFDIDTGADYERAALIEKRLVL